MPDLPDYCEYLPAGSRQPCYAPAPLVLVRPSGPALRAPPGAPILRRYREL